MSDNIVFRHEISIEAAEWVVGALRKRRLQGLVSNRRTTVNGIIDAVSKGYKITHEAHNEILQCLFELAQADPGSLKTR